MVLKLSYSLSCEPDLVRSDSLHHFPRVLHHKSCTKLLKYLSTSLLLHLTAINSTTQILRRIMKLGMLMLSFLKNSNVVFLTHEKRKPKHNFLGFLKTLAAISFLVLLSPENKDIKIH